MRALIAILKFVTVFLLFYAGFILSEIYWVIKRIA